MTLFIVVHCASEESKQKWIAYFEALGYRCKADGLKLEVWDAM